MQPVAGLVDFSSDSVGVWVWTVCVWRASLNLQLTSWGLVFRVRLGIVYLEIDVLLDSEN